MARLIDADKLIELIDDDIASLNFMDMSMSRESYDVCLCTLKMVKQYIKALPTIEAEPTKHGRWIVISEYPKKAECSYCGYPIEHELVCWWDYCPNCGAKMDAQIGEDKSHPFAESVMMGMGEEEE